MSLSFTYYFSDVSIGDKKLSAIMGELIWEEISRCIIHECLLYSIPNNSSQLEKYSTVWTQQHFVMCCEIIMTQNYMFIDYHSFTHSRWSRKRRSLRSLWRRWSICRATPQTCSNTPGTLTVTSPERNARISSWRLANSWPPRCTTPSKYVERGLVVRMNKPQTGEWFCCQDLINKGNY